MNQDKISKLLIKAIYFNNMFHESLEEMGNQSDAPLDCVRTAQALLALSQALPDGMYLYLDAMRVIDSPCLKSLDCKYKWSPTDIIVEVEGKTYVVPYEVLK
ncbi:MAG: hypothetical protein [Podoviridae sp. ctjc_2]|nr:MAG: hypothetical protein [Podoviridae sp. ctjc_2]